MGSTEEKFWNKKIVSRVLGKYIPNGDMKITNKRLEQDLAV